LHTRRCYTS